MTHLASSSAHSKRSASDMDAVAPASPKRARTAAADADADAGVKIEAESADSYQAAKDCLEAMREYRRTRLGFGNDGVQFAATQAAQRLTAYYPALGLASALLKADPMSEAATEFLTDVPLPADLKSIAQTLLSADTKHGLPLGNCAHAWPTVLMPESAYALSDDAIQTLWCKPEHRAVSSYIRDAEAQGFPDFYVGAVARLFARVFELGLGSPELSASLCDVKWTRTMYDRPDLQNALQRLADACGKTCSQLMQQTFVEPLPSFTDECSASILPPVERRGEARALHLTQALLKTDQPATFVCDDEALAYMGRLPGGFLAIASSHRAELPLAWHKAFVLGWDRWIHTDISACLQEEAYAVQAYMRMYVVPSTLLDDDEYCADLATLISHTNIRIGSGMLDLGDRTDSSDLSPDLAPLLPRLRRGLDATYASIDIDTPQAPSTCEIAATCRAAQIAIANWTKPAHSSAAKRLEALCTVADGLTNEDTPRILSALCEAYAKANLPPVEYDKLSAAQRAAAVQSFLTIDSMATLTMVGPRLMTFSDDFCKDYTQAYEAASAAASSEREQSSLASTLLRAQTIGAMSTEAYQKTVHDMSVSSTYNEAMLNLRLKLMSMPSMTASELVPVCARYWGPYATGTFLSLLDRAEFTEGAAGDTEVILDYLQAVWATGRLQDEVCTILVEGQRKGSYKELSFERLFNLTATPTAETNNRLVGRVAWVDQFSSTSFTQAFLKHLQKIYQQEIDYVMPLDEADLRIKQAQAMSRSAKLAGLHLGGSIVVGDIHIPRPGRHIEDRRAIPAESQADLVLTNSVQANLKFLAIQWRTRRPVLLEGPTSAGKTSLVRYMALKMQLPYRRLSLSYETDVSDLLGRYVGGEIRHTQQALAHLSEEALLLMAKAEGLDVSLARERLIDQVFEAQLKPRWVDGSVVTAMRQGDVLLLDEINLARPQVIERLNSLFDDDGDLVLTEHRNERISAHPDFRCFATMNPATYAGRGKLSDAMRSRWSNLYCHGSTKEDLVKILRTRFGAMIPDDELAKLIGVHTSLAASADAGDLGRTTGGVSFSLRKLFRVCERFLRYRSASHEDAWTMRREVEEVYLGSLLSAEDQRAARDVLRVAMPLDNTDFYSSLRLAQSAVGTTLGDVVLSPLGIEPHPLIPTALNSLLVETPRTLETLYRLAKALDCGENVLLVGERACGKTAVVKMYAHLVQQPYYRQLISASTDAAQLVGGYDDQGWKDGLLLMAARPEAVPGVLLLDELNLGNSALLERLNSVLDDERKLVLAEKEGEHVPLHPKFCFVSAMNPSTRQYGGRQKLSQALQDRLTVITVGSLDTEAEQLSITLAAAKTRGVSVHAAKALVSLHRWVATGYAAGTLGKMLREGDRPVLSIRQLNGAMQVMAEMKDDEGEAEGFLSGVRLYYAATSIVDDCEAIMQHAATLTL